MQRLTARSGTFALGRLSRSGDRCGTDHRHSCRCWVSPRLKNRRSKRTNVGRTLQSDPLVQTPRHWGFDGNGRHQRFATGVARTVAGGVRSVSEPPPGFVGERKPTLEGSRRVENRVERGISATPAGVDETNVANFRWSVRFARSTTGYRTSRLRRRADLDNCGLCHIVLGLRRVDAIRRTSASQLFSFFADLCGRGRP
jgi:hypothetical protein